MSSEVSWRRAYPVLVAEAHALGSVGVIRSLGRAGYPVHACSQRSDALGFLSNYAHAATVCPAYHDPGFVKWLREYVERTSIRAIIPSEGFLLGLRGSLAEFAHLLPVNTREDLLYAGLSKYNLFQSLTAGASEGDASGNLPPTLLVRPAEGLPEARDLEALGLPIYIKVDGCHGRGWREGAVYRMPTVTAACHQVAELAPSFEKFLVQGHVPGQGVGVFFLRWDDVILAEFMHRRLHEVPHTGGVSSLRESWWHQAIRDDALAKLQHMQWRGVAMMEYRWDPNSDTFCFLEMNGRFWGSIHLALYAGVDFPTLLLDTFHARPAMARAGFPMGLRCRYTFPREIEYVWSRLKDRDLRLAARLFSLVEFFLVSLDPRVYSDLLFPGDRRLYLQSIARFGNSLYTHP